MDILKRVVVSLVGMAMIVYIVSFLALDKIMVLPEYANNNLLAGSLLILLTAFFTAIYGIYPITIKWHKTTLFLLGLCLIVFGKQYLINDISNGVYIGDFTILFGVFIVLFGATGVLITKTIKKKENQKNVEIIEV